MNTEELTQVLWKIDPMGTGCAEDEDMQDEYESQAREIIDLVTKGEDHRTAVIRVFDEWFWEDCLISGSREIALNKIVAALK